MKRRTRKNFKRHSKTYVCDKGKSLDECELEIVRNAVDIAEQKQGKKKIMTPEIQEIVGIVEDYLKKKRLICYGGTAINNILPLSDQFYNKEIELPDYDFYSMNALEDAKELANIYYKAGFEEVQASSGQHYGTYKVYVNFIPIADITQISGEIYKNIKKESIRVAGIYYAPPNFLRMAMYLELSRPDGDVSRWEKVLKRLILLNKNYPLKGKECNLVDVQREMETSKIIKKQNLIYRTVRDSFSDQGVIFFGSYANSLYLNYLPKKRREQYIPDFDVLSDDPETTILIVKERLEDEGITGVKVKKHDKIGELVTKHYELIVHNETVAFIYEPLACHSYNKITIKNKVINVATIDTMFSFFLAFYYSNREYYDKNRILCMCNLLFSILQKNRLNQRGLLKRFSLNCYGNQPTIEDMRSTKAQMFEELKNKKTSKEYEQWFLRYAPRDSKNKNKNKKNKNKKRNNEKQNSKKRKTMKRSITVPGAIGKTVRVSKNKLPDTIKANYSLTPTSINKTQKIRKKGRKNRRKRKSQRSFLGFRF